MNSKNIWQYIPHLIGFIGLVIIAIGIMIYLRESKAKENLLITEGEIIYSKILSSSGRKRTYYYIDIKYKYLVQGKTYTSSEEPYSSHNKNEVEQEFIKYKAGSKLKVYYGQEDPSMNFLSPESTRGGMPLILLGSIVIIFSIIFIFLKNVRNKKILTR